MVRVFINVSVVLLFIAYCNKIVPFGGHINVTSAGSLVGTKLRRRRRKG